MPKPAAVRARGVRKVYDDVVALDAVDLDVAPGRIHGLVGPNGAGKTTLLGLLLHLTAPDAGTLEILGAPSSSLPAGVAGFVDGPGLYPTLTARQNLRATTDLQGLRGVDVDAALAEVGLADVAHDRVRGFSLGMRQRLGLAAALIAAPRLLVLDEPANGLDPAGTRQVHRVLTRLAAEGTAVVLSSHRMDDLAALCDEVTILATGRVVFTGPLAKLDAEAGELEYRVRTPDPATARHVLAAADTVRALPPDDPDGPRDPDVLVVRGTSPALEDALARLVDAGVVVREFAPQISPLEAAFLALTGHGDDGAAR